MIPLSSIDFATVLKGARIPLHVPSAPLARHEWCADHYYQRNSYGMPSSIPIEAVVSSEVFLDPTDPDVARLLDRRIAEAIKVDRPTVELGIATEMGREIFAIYTLVGWIPINRKMYRGIKVIPANIPIARAALIKALYPRTA